MIFPPTRSAIKLRIDSRDGEKLKLGVSTLRSYSREVRLGSGVHAANLPLSEWRWFVTTLWYRGDLNKRGVAEHKHTQANAAPLLHSTAHDIIGYLFAGPPRFLLSQK